ncbi:DUF3397 family protein [Secundilactobacillus kimchicus]|nr:DUF3397 family protein [Secundilactobacillus kimchicus]
MGIVMMQLIVLVGAWVLVKLIQRVGRSPKLKKIRFRDGLPFFLAFFIWQLAHLWTFPWWAYLLMGWAILGIGVTCYLAAKRGEILWRKFLVLFLRLSGVYLFLGYIATILAMPWLK